MEKTVLQTRIEKENEILKNLNREILKSAKKGDFHYYWDITGISPYLVKTTISTLEKEGKFFKSKGTNFKIIHW
ncbi:hypothetical protein M0Q97_12010 [Candidatus Dojkabacteria bacterium]|jgi:hypothetical protein|nr:hypothetical protein [Candidatus Dojkabacteria bacterium]